jgi:hypothetical protein
MVCRVCWRRQVASLRIRIHTAALLAGVIRWEET